MRLRPLLVADWPETYRTVWQPVVAAGGSYLYPRDTDERAARALWCLPPPGQVWVVEDAGRIVGTALLRPNQPGTGSHVANAAFMVAPEAEGRGIGRWLAGQVMDAARESGYEAMQFNAVLAGNARAVALWRSLGFAVVGRVPGGFRDGQRRDDLLIMHRRL